MGLWSATSISGDGASSRVRYVPTKAGQPLTRQVPAWLKEGVKQEAEWSRDNASYGVERDGDNRYERHEAGETEDSGG